MKKYLFLVVLLVAGCASTPPANPPANGSIYSNVFDNEGRIVADVNKTNGDIRYYQSPEIAFKALYLAFVSYYNQAEAIIHPKPPTPPAAGDSKTKPEVKKEKK